MPALSSRPLFTNEFARFKDFVLEDGAVYIHASSEEERSAVPAEWIAAHGGVRFVNVVSQSAASMTVEGLSGMPIEVSLRSAAQLEALWKELSPAIAYLDITGMIHPVWSALVRGARLAQQEIRVVYVEPISYKFSAAPTEGELFDLSERVDGVRALPGFARLQSSEEDRVCLVALLGFEGARFSFIREQVQPPGMKIIPVFGLPGFRPEFPFYAYLGNRLPLLESQCWRVARYARANCPFSCFYTLEDIHNRYPEDLMKIAPIGTKPHALGAVLYFLAERHPVDLVYDHPVRKAGRTVGSARILVYHVSAFLR